ncbi:MAG: division plane positioning ATPase MipZ [Alphaproteobacteria bacterium]
MNKRAHIIVFGNEKGGVGKSTTAVHVATSLLKKGKTVVTIDLDARQGTLTRYIENRQKYMQEKDEKLLLPIHHTVHASQSDNLEEANSDNEKRLNDVLKAHLMNVDVIVIDCPGGDNYLSRLAHVYADTLITPVNDSFIDLDLLVHVNPETMEVEKPSYYSELVWEIRKIRASRNQPPLNWIVLRNRLSNLYSKNKADVDSILGKAAQRIGFHRMSGFAERVIFRELFLKGLTLFDLREVGGVPLTLSHISAKKEIEALLRAVEKGVTLHHGDLKDIEEDARAVSPKDVAVGA